MLLLGGTGLLGGQVLMRMREQKYPVRLYTRGSRDWRDSSVHDLRHKGIEVMIADAYDEERLERAADGCSAIINMVGEMPPRVGTDFERLHLGVVQNVLKIAQRLNIQRVVHVSCLGAEEDSPSEYLRTKYQAEQIVRNADLYWTMFRPSYIFAGDKFPFLDLMAPLIRFKLFMPVIGDGQNAIQPVHASDVADCIVRSIYEKETVGKNFDLAGAEQISLFELMNSVRMALKMPGASVNLPSTSATAAVSALSKALPKSTFSIDMVHMLMSNSITDSNSLVDYFKINPISIRDSIQQLALVYKR